MDNNITTPDPNLEQDLNTENKPAELKDEHAEKPHDLRKQLEKANKKVAELAQQLTAKEQAELDKNKTLEEKLADKDRKLQEAEVKLKQTETTFSLKETLMNSNVSPEFLPLLVESAKSKLGEVEVADIVSELQTQYPSAFVSEVKQQPIGKVGTSITNGGNVPTYTKDQVAKLLLDPTTRITPELQRMANEYKL
jgi:hypothetical protein